VGSKEKRHKKLDFATNPLNMGESPKEGTRAKRKRHQKSTKGREKKNFAHRWEGKSTKYRGRKD